MQGVPLQIDALDSSESWLSTLRAKHGVLNDAQAAGKLAMHSVDIGETGKWGIPAGWSQRSSSLQAAQARDYVENSRLVCCYDVILVDGRFREACAMHALRLAHEGTLVLVHDSARYMRGPANQTWRQYYDLVRAVFTLAVLRPRADALSRARNQPNMFASRYYEGLLHHGEW